MGCQLLLHGFVQHFLREQWLLVAKGLADEDQGHNSLTARVQSLEALPSQIQTLTDRVKASTYVGTGKYGSNNKNSVAFPARPKAVFVSGPNSAVFPGTAASGFVNSDGYDMIPFSWSGNTLSWYNAQDPAYQLNENGVTYTCLALYL